MQILIHVGFVPYSAGEVVCLSMAMKRRRWFPSRSANAKTWQVLGKYPQFGLHSSASTERMALTVVEFERCHTGKRVVGLTGYTPSGPQTPPPSDRRSAHQLYWMEDQAFHCGLWE